MPSAAVPLSSLVKCITRPQLTCQYDGKQIYGTTDACRQVSSRRRVTSAVGLAINFMVSKASSGQSSRTPASRNGDPRPPSRLGAAFLAAYHHFEMSCVHAPTPLPAMLDPCGRRETVGSDLDERRETSRHICTITLLVCCSNDALGQAVHPREQNDPPFRSRQDTCSSTSGACVDPNQISRSSGITCPSKRRFMPRHTSDYRARNARPRIAAT